MIFEDTFLFSRKLMKTNEREKYNRLSAAGQSFGWVMRVVFLVFERSFKNIIRNSGVSDCKRNDDYDDDYYTFSQFFSRKYLIVEAKQQEKRLSLFLFVIIIVILIHEVIERLKYLKDKFLSSNEWMRVTTCELSHFWRDTDNRYHVRFA